MKSHPNVVVTIMIEFNSKFLLIARDGKEENFANLWAFPGGKVELNETLVDTIRRETLEETGLSLTDEGVFLDTYFFKNTVGVAFLVRATSSQVVLDLNEIKEYVWVSSVDELKKYNCIPGIYNHLKRALDMFNKGVFDSLEDMNLIQSKYINQ